MRRFASYCYLTGNFGRNRRQELQGGIPGGEGGGRFAPLFWITRRMCGGGPNEGTCWRVARWPGPAAASFVDRATRRPFGLPRHSLIKRNQSVTPAVCMYTCRWTPTRPVYTGPGSCTLCSRQFPPPCFRRGVAARSTVRLVASLNTHPLERFKFLGCAFQIFRISAPCVPDSRIFSASTRSTFIF